MPTMVANHPFTRVDTIELKDHLFRKIGPQRAEKYLDHLKRFFSLKLSKSEFDRSCIRTIGRENLPLHNKLIRSIVQNACHAKTPPQKRQKSEGLGVKVPNGYQRSCIQSLYGDALPQSPRKCRSPVSRDRKLRDRPSPLGPLGKSPSITCEDTVRTQEQQSATEPQSHCSRPPVEEDGEEVEQFSGCDRVRRWRSVAAPFGVAANAVDPRMSHHCGYSYNNGFSETCLYSSELPDSISLRTRMEKKLASAGIGVPPECAIALNNSLDAYLKRLIEPCIGIAGSRRASGGKSNDLGMVDFRVAVESNPRLLGQDWPIQVEKISAYAAEV
ncbi:uncharacterized protein LOC127262655 [Andrographis paniculata]|uniref:uncharacterized protein LOC127262655 n=1 Tax=Andrographis paniculata TaxID=175694 RepID=UPI0021E79B95|nr:uncharacterized protein LOC127262655 [Andrographis paniculata]